MSVIYFIHTTFTTRQEDIKISKKREKEKKKKHGRAHTTEHGSKYSLFEFVQYCCVP